MVSTGAPIVHIGRVGVFAAFPRNFLRPLARLTPRWLDELTSVPFRFHRYFFADKYWQAPRDIAVAVRIKLIDTARLSVRLHESC